MRSPAPPPAAASTTATKAVTGSPAALARYVYRSLQAAACTWRRRGRWQPLRRRADRRRRAAALAGAMLGWAEKRALGRLHAECAAVGRAAVLRGALRRLREPAARQTQLAFLGLLEREEAQKEEALICGTRLTRQSLHQRPPLTPLTAPRGSAIP